MNLKKETAVDIEIIDLHEDGFHPLIKVKLFDKVFTLVLDTGASKTAFDQTLMLQANIGMEVTISDRLSTGLGTNSMTSSTAVIDDLFIGDLFIDSFTVAVLDLSSINIAYSQLGYPEVLGVLGGDILMKYNAIINYGSKKLTLNA